MTEAQLLTRLRKAVKEAGGQRSFARAHGFSAAYVNDVLHGRRDFADNICKVIGVKRAIVFTTTYQQELKDETL